jgi:hypothetical protein
MNFQYVSRYCEDVSDVRAPTNLISVASLSPYRPYPPHQRRFGINRTPSQHEHNAALMK